MIFVDSSVWIDYLRDLETLQTKRLDSILGNERVVVGDLVIAEVLQGCNDSKTFNDTVRLFQRSDFVGLSATLSTSPLLAVTFQASRSASQRSARRPGAKQYSPPRVTTKGGRFCRRRRIGSCGMVNDATPSRGPTSGSA